ncbi:MAG: oligosaccharide flippase family protein [Calditrichia bacterium]
MPPSKTLKRTFSLYSAQVANLVLGWIAAKINISYLTVGEFGQFNFFLTIINVLYVIFTFGVFESASREIALTKSKAVYHELLGVTLFFAGIIYLLFSSLFWASHWIIDDIFAVKTAELIKWLFPVAGAYVLLNMWQLSLRGAEKIYLLSWVSVSPRLVYIVILPGLIFAGSFSLLNTALANLLSIFAVGLALLLAERPRFNRFRQNFQRLWRSIKTFGVQIYWSELIRVLLYHTDKLLISYFWDADNLAYYSLAYTITFPLSFFSSALSTTLYRRFSDASKIDARFLRYNLIWIIISVSILILLRKWIILYLFSQAYQSSLLVFTWLALAFGVAGLTKLYSIFLTAKGAGNYIRIISIWVLAAHLALNFSLIPLWGILGAAVSALATYLLDLLLVIFYYRKYRLRSAVLEKT